MFVCPGKCRRPSLVLGACLIDGRNCCRMGLRWAAPHLYYVSISLSWNLEPLRVICTEGGYSGQLHHPDWLNTPWTREQDLKPGAICGQKNSIHIIKKQINEAQGNREAYSPIWLCTRCTNKHGANRKTLEIVHNKIFWETQLMNTTSQKCWRIS